MGKSVLLTIGQKFNNLTVISEPKKLYKKSIGYECKCDCGNTSNYLGCHLINNISKYCKDCSRKNQIKININIGDIFEDLVVKTSVIDSKRIKNGQRFDKIVRFYQCECKCGDIRNYTASALWTNRAKRCPTCAYKLRPQSTTKYSPLERIFRLSIIDRVKKKNIPVEITMDEYSKIIENNCYYCGAFPKLKKYAGGIIWANGVDRIDSSKGYTLDNCVACCKKCNTMKMDMKPYEFFEQILKIIKHHNLNDKTRIF